jgi:hypothetical protein
MVSAFVLGSRLRGNERVGWDRATRSNHILL